MFSSMRWRNGDTVGVEPSMILLLSVNETECLDHQHRRTSGSTSRHHTRRSAHRASGLVQRLTAVIAARDVSGATVPDTLAAAEWAVEVLVREALAEAAAAAGSAKLS